MSEFDINNFISKTSSDILAKQSNLGSANNSKIEIFKSKKKNLSEGVSIESTSVDNSAHILIKAELYKSFVNELKQKLFSGVNESGTNISTKRRNLEQGIIASFVSMDIKEQEDINNILDNISKQEGFDFPLKLTQKDKNSGISGYKGSKYYISRMSSSGNTVPATDEQLSKVAKYLARELDFALADSLSIKTDRSMSSQDLHKAIDSNINSLNEIYKSAFNRKFEDGYFVKESGLFFDDKVYPDDYLNSQKIKFNIDDCNADMLSKIKDAFIYDGLEAKRPVNLPEVKVTAFKKNVPYKKAKEYSDMLLSLRDSKNEFIFEKDFKKFLNDFNTQAIDEVRNFKDSEGKRVFQDEEVDYAYLLNNIKDKTRLDAFKYLLNSKDENNETRYNMTSIVLLLDNISTVNDLQYLKMLSETKNKDGKFKFSPFDMEKLINIKKNKVNDTLLSDKEEVISVNDFKLKVMDTRRAWYDNNVSSDRKKVEDGVSISPMYKEGTSMVKIAEETSVGEVASIGEELYCKSKDGEMVKLNFTRSKYLELFPPVERFNFSQGRIGDCWLISTIDNLMNNPETRIHLYQLFSQEGDDLYIKLPEMDKSVKFPDGNVILSEEGRNVCGPKGIQMIEQACAINRAAKRVKFSNYVSEVKKNNETFYDVTKFENIDDLMYTLKSGSTLEALYSLLKIKNKKSVHESFSYSLHGKLDTKKNIENMLSKGDNVVMFFSTKGDSESVENELRPEYDLYTSHGYSIKHYDKNNGMVTFSNPWQSGEITRINIYDLLNEIKLVTFLSL